jgi:hypothetical protein
MPFKPGQSGNPTGRPKNVPNKSTTEIKSLMQSFISENIETLQRDFDALEAKDRLMFFERALKFILPTQQSNEININSLSNDELDKLTDSLISKLNSNE